MTLEPIFVVTLVAALAVGALIAMILAGSRGEAVRAAEADARLRQLADSQAAAQAQMAEALRAQERALAQALDTRLGDFSRRVGERLKETSNKSQESLTDLRERLAVIDRAQKNITELSSQVVGLQDILANKQARGAFGEVQLQDIVQSVLPPSAYDFQATLGNGRRADCLLKLPNPPGAIAIDAKFPLESYQALRLAEDEARGSQAARQLASDLRKHVKDIAERYIVAGETAESALLFLPSEAVYAELHANFRPVVEESYRARVWIVSPTTLMATLNTVRAVLKDVYLREQAGVIQTEIQHMADDVGRLDGRVEKLQRHFDQAGEDLRQIRISTDKVTRRAERIEELQLGDPPGNPTRHGVEVEAPPKPRLVQDETR